MRAWIAAVAVLSVLALGAGGGEVARDRGHASHAHAVLVAKILAHRRVTAAVDRAVPAPRVIVVAPDRSFSRIASAPPVIAAPSSPLAVRDARAPPSA